MRVTKFLIGIWVAVAVYAIFSFLGGPKSLTAYNFLLSERDNQFGNINDLRNINEELERTRNSLLFDQETIMVHARNMGYGQEDERFVRIVGLGNINPIPATTGNVYKAQQPDFIPVKNIIIAAICIGLLVFIFLLMLEFIESRSRL